MQVLIISCAVGEARFGSSPDEGRIAELESLQTFLKEATALIDSRTQALAAPTERLRKLLSAKDKKATLMDMAGKPLRWLLTATQVIAEFPSHCQSNCGFTGFVLTA